MGMHVTSACVREYVTMLRDNNKKYIKLNNFCENNNSDMRFTPEYAKLKYLSSGNICL